VLVVSGESAEAAKVKALGIGADDYLVKPFGKQELLARISAVMRRVDLAASGRIGGPGEAPSGVLTAGSLTLEPARHEARVGAIPLSLTPTEFRLLGRSSGPAATSSPTTGWRGRLARRARPGPAVAEAAPRPPARRWRRSAGRGSSPCARSATGSRPTSPPERRFLRERRSARPRRDVPRALRRRAAATRLRAGRTAAWPSRHGQ
jgi:hypothetical protein